MTVRVVVALRPPIALPLLHRREPRVNPWELLAHVEALVVVQTRLHPLDVRREDHVDDRKIPVEVRSLNRRFHLPAPRDQTKEDFFHFLPKAGIFLPKGSFSEDNHTILSML